MTSLLHPKIYILLLLLINPINADIILQGDSTDTLPQPVLSETLIPDTLKSTNDTISKDNSLNVISKVNEEPKSSIDINTLKQYEVNRTLIAIDESTKQLYVSSKIKIAGLVLGGIGMYMLFRDINTGLGAGLLFAGSISIPIATLIDLDAYSSLLEEREIIRSVVSDKSSGNKKR